MKHKPDIEICRRAAAEVVRLAEKRKIPKSVMMRQMGLNRQLWYDWQHGDAAPGSDSLSRLAWAGANIDYILTGRQKMIQVLVKHPGHPPFMVWTQNNLETLQGLVGGYIETVTLAEDLVLICNEEGFLRGLPDCCELCGMRLVGTIALAGVKGTEFSDVPMDYEGARKRFPEMWEVA